MGERVPHLKQRLTRAQELEDTPVTSSLVPTSTKSTISFACYQEVEEPGLSPK